MGRIIPEDAPQIDNVIHFSGCIALCLPFQFNLGPRVRHFIHIARLSRTRSLSHRNFVICSSSGSEGIFQVSASRGLLGSISDSYTKRIYFRCPVPATFDLLKGHEASNEKRNGTSAGLKRQITEGDFEVLFCGAASQFCINLTGTNIDSFDNEMVC